MAKILDFSGNEYSSFDEMCVAYSINPKTVQARLDKGKTLKEALTEEVVYSTKKDNVVDHLGTHYKSEAQMCRAYHIPLMTYRRRLERNMSLEEALTIPSGSCNSVTDHEGTVFPTVSALCRHWGVTTEKYNRKIRQGCTIEQALDNDFSGKEYIDYLGNVFVRWQDYADHWGMPRGTLSHRIKSGVEGSAIVAGSRLAGQLERGEVETGLVQRGGKEE